MDRSYLVIINHLLLNENDDFLILGNVAGSRLRGQHGGPNGSKLEYVFTPYGLKMVL